MGLLICADVDNAVLLEPQQDATGRIEEVAVADVRPGDIADAVVAGALVTGAASVFGPLRLQRRNVEQQYAVDRRTSDDAQVLRLQVGRSHTCSGPLDELLVEWHRDNGEPGTTQSNPEDPMPR
ncbi:hypothetical protein ABT075_24915 [Streptomyces sp. NPDC002677]|uniref:hypothetical protein n=1 Tax=Streptomyces sp. NPDC002677 TaxID=3154774 RepID=UPI003330732F